MIGYGEIELSDPAIGRPRPSATRCTGRARGGHEEQSATGIPCIRVSSRTRSRGKPRTDTTINVAASPTRWRIEGPGPIASHPTDQEV
jgi:hypothetical protein